MNIANLINLKSQLSTLKDQYDVLDKKATRFEAIAAEVEGSEGIARGARADAETFRNLHVVPVEAEIAAIERGHPNN